MTGEEHTATTPTGPLAGSVGGENPQPLTDTHTGDVGPATGPLGVTDAIVEDDADDAAGAAAGFGPLGEPTAAEQAVIDAEIMPASSGFEEFWAAYPRRVGKRRAQAEYVKALRSGVSHEELLAGVKRFAWSKRDVNPRYVVHPDRWLAEGRWEDEESSLVSSPTLRDIENDVDYYQRALDDPMSFTNLVGLGDVERRRNRQVADGFMRTLAQKRENML